MYTDEKAEEGFFFDKFCNACCITQIWNKKLRAKVEYFEIFLLFYYRLHALIKA